MVGLPWLGEGKLEEKGERWQKGEERGGGMGFGMARGALLVLRESKSLLGKLEPANDGLAISLTMENFSM